MVRRRNKDNGVGRDSELLPLQKLERLLTVVSLIIVVAGTFYNMFAKPIGALQDIKSSINEIKQDQVTMHDEIIDLKDEVKYLRRLK